VAYVVEEFELMVKMGKLVKKFENLFLQDNILEKRLNK
jgi:hypothetical protein